VGWVGWVGWGQKVIPRPSADYFVVGRRQKGECIERIMAYMMKETY
jgi:hypothetical protein